MLLFVVLLIVAVWHWPFLSDPLGLGIAVLALFGGEGGRRGPGDRT